MADNETKLLSTLDVINGKLDEFQKSSKAEIKAAQDGVATVKAELDTQRKQLQEIAEVAKRVPAMPADKRELAREMGRLIIAAHYGRPVTKAQVEGTDNVGGYLVNDDLRTEIKSVQNRYGAVQSIWGDSIIPMPSDVTKIPVDTYGETNGSDPVPVAVNEGSQLTEDAATVDQVTLTAAKYAGYVYVSQELLDDAFVDALGAWLTPKIARQIAKKKDALVFTTNSTGILKSSNITSVTMSSGDGAFTDISYDYLLDMQDAVCTDGLADGMYLGHRSVLNLLRKKRAGSGYGSDDGKGAYLLPGGDAIVQQTAAGPVVANYPWVNVEVCPASSSTAVSTGFVLFGDPRLAVVIGERGGDRIETSRDFKFDYDLVTVRYIFRFAWATNANLGKALARLITNAST